MRHRIIMGKHTHLGAWKSAVLRVAALLLSVASVGTAAATEPWADQNLPSADGLELWFDAARGVATNPGIIDGSFGEWRDASGHKRDLKQPVIEAQPNQLKVDGGALVHFDGVGDHLRSAAPGAQLQQFTVVLVLAPRANLGGFRGFLAFNAKDQRDYESGFTIDQGPSASAKFSNVNLEGKGFGGAQNLRTQESPFGKLQTIIATSDAATRSVRLLIDGQPEGARPRDGSPLSIDEITVGARYYNNAAGPQHVDGFSRADIAEVLVYSRALSPKELKELQRYLDAKYARLKESLPPDVAGTAPLETVENPPPLQMFVPGFSTRELPLDLTNINNVKYRPDGTLVALAYDGKIWLLRDTDGNGLEDKADLFWDNASGLRSPIGMDLTPPGYDRGNGVFVIGKTRCTLIVDTNGDDKADKEIPVADGWKESFHQVDGLGVAYDARDGSVYFGRGTYNFADPLLKDKDGKPQYHLSDEGSTIIHVSPDFKKHEIVATGIRFPVGLRFNPRGDLFATDQEGATWVPNGNPFDELLHIQRGRHYGFPARHPEYLPNVIDEPSTFDYAPQHQSLCGFNFNVPVKPKGPIFGPSLWADDAILTGYSRGKLYRTKLALSPSGYVAQTQLLACLSLLTVDACISPDGGLVVACHSGAPDWGTGPTGKGKLFKLSYSDPEHPQPVLAWAINPREVRVEFDRPVPPARLRDVLVTAKLTAGKYVRAGDRFESIAPGYAAVQAQKLTPRYDVPLRSAQLTPDGRTLVLATDAIDDAVHYALTLPDQARTKSGEPGELPQHPQIDLDFDFTGCAATWQSANRAEWEGWLPHLDLGVCREFTKGSAPHEALWPTLDDAGDLTLSGQLDLVDMLRPAVQPGSKIDYEYPPEFVTVVFSTSSSNSKLELTGDAAKYMVENKGQHVSFTVPANAPKLVPFELKVSKQRGPASLAVSWTTNEDKRPRPLPLRRVLLPWAAAKSRTEDGTTPAPLPAELAGGSWSRGYREFYGEQAMCSKCHSLYSRGGKLGPDLSNLVHRDYASVVRDISHPSFAINPDYLTYTVILNDGRVLSGVIHTIGDTIQVGDAKGLITDVKRSDIDEMVPASVSTMPEGLPLQLGPDRMRDLVTFLLAPSPAMPRDFPGPRPKPRTLAEVDEVLAGAPKSAEKSTRPLHILLVAGPKDHGVGEHDYPAWQKAWPELLRAAPNVEVSTAWEWPTAEEFQKADVAVFYQHGAWNDQRAQDTDAFLKRGGGMVYLHWALDGGDRGKEFAERIGLAKDKALAYRHGPLELIFNRDAQHPITRNFDRLKLVDESYWKLEGPLPKNRILATSLEEGEPQPQLWTTEHGKGRVFVAIPGHYSWTFDDPLFRVLVFRGILWTAHEPVDRFNELVWLGADR